MSIILLPPSVNPIAVKYIKPYELQHTLITIWHMYVYTAIWFPARRNYRNKVRS